MGWKGVNEYQGSMKVKRGGRRGANLAFHLGWGETGYLLKTTLDYSSLIGGRN